METTVASGEEERLSTGTLTVVENSALSSSTADYADQQQTPKLTRFSAKGRAKFMNRRLANVTVNQQKKKKLKRKYSREDTIEEEAFLVVTKKFSSEGLETETVAPVKDSNRVTKSNVSPEVARIMASLPRILPTLGVADSDYPERGDIMFSPTPDDIVSTGTEAMSKHNQEAKGKPSKGSRAYVAGPNMAYSWEALGLGITTGSAAVNQYLRQVKGPSHRRDVTAQDALYIMSTLRAKTWRPPENSPLHRVLQTTRRQEDISGGVENFGDNNTTPLPWKMLSNVYRTMVSQDADDGLSYRNIVLHHYTAAEAMSQLRAFENRITDLAYREDMITRRRGKELGLIPGVTIPHYLDYLHKTSFTG